MDLPVHLWQSARARGILIGARVFKIFVEKAHGEQEREIVDAVGAHPHLVSWSPGGASMQWASRGDLDCARGHVSEAWAQAAMRQLAAALVHIESKGFVHTRVTPCHVLIDADRHVRLTGLRACVRLLHLCDALDAVAFEAPFAAPELLCAKDVVHTPSFLPMDAGPEDLSGCVKIASATWHSWALAITILIALCGHSPWTLAMPTCTKFAVWVEDPTPETLARLCGIKPLQNKQFASTLCGLLAPTLCERLLVVDIMHAA